MSFSTETKNELSRLTPEKKCCQLSEIAGFLRVSGSLSFVLGGQFKISVSTDNPAVARHYKKLIKEYFRIDTELSVKERSNFSKGYKFILTIGPEEKSEQILRETGILLVREGNNFISDGIYTDLIRSKCCKKAYLRGMFMASGSVSDPEKGYHLELSVASARLANDLRKLINSFDDLSCKVLERKNSYSVYMKSSAYIRDVLALMGAHSQVLAFDNVLIKKEMVNETVRITNCDNANTDRALDASQKQQQWIRKIEEHSGLESLPPKLQEVAKLRLSYPEASLTQLGELADPPLKKSGVNNRLKKIQEIAEKL